MDSDPLVYEMFHDGMAPGAVTHAQPVDNKEAITCHHNCSAFPVITLRFMRCRLLSQGGLSQEVTRRSKIAN